MLTQRLNQFRINADPGQAKADSMQIAMPMVMTAGRDSI